MKKEEMEKYLIENNIEVPTTFKEIQKLYFKSVKDNKVITTDNNIITPIVEQNDIDKLEYDQDVIKNNLIKDIINLMNELKGRTRGTGEEIKTMFMLYNNFYKRNDSPSCPSCVNNVYTKLFNIYKKYR
jgi:hypothetical protein